MHSTEMGELDIPALPIAARHAHIVPALNGQSLISIGQLFDSGCDVTLNAMTIAVNHEGTPIFHGTRNPATKLWELDASQTEPVEFSNAAIGSPSPENLVALAHAALFSPALTTMETALRKGYLTNFPGLTTRSFRRYPPKSRATVKGHFDQTRQNIRSTQVRTTQPIIEHINDYYPSDIPHSDNNATIFADMLDIPDVTGCKSVNVQFYGCIVPSGSTI